MTDHDRAVKTGAVIYQSELVSEIWAEVWPLLKQHWLEVSNNLDIPLEPNIDLYGVAEKQGVFKLFTARIDNELVGYAAFMISNGLHNASAVVAIQDVLYVKPAHRKSRVGYKLIQFCDDQLREIGIDIVYHHTKVKHDFGRLLERIGYKFEEKVYFRRL